MRHVPNAHPARRSASRSTTRNNVPDRGTRRLPWLLVLTGLGLGAPHARAADPSLATYSRDAHRMFWILHISDTHIGATPLEDHDSQAHLTWALGEALDVIHPELVIHTGDITDGSKNNIPTSGQDQAEWNDYRGIVDAAGMTPAFYLDLPGNHDGYGDVGLTYYLANSLNGVDQGVPYREILLSFPFGDYLIFGLNSAGNGSGPFSEQPAFPADMVALLDASLTAHDSLPLALLFAHHPIDVPAGAASVIALAQQHEAFYFHGHVHAYGSYLDQSVWSAQVSSLGKKDTDNLAVIAVDNDALSYAATSTNAPWPFVVITAPVSARLDSGEANPYAYPVCNTGTDNPVRALVFDAAPVSAVSVSINAGPFAPMTQDPAEPRLWQGIFDAQGLPEGEVTLTIQAIASTTRAVSIPIYLSDVSCPPPLPTSPDGGLTDAGADLDGGAAADASGDGAAPADASGLAPDAGVPSSGDNGGCGCRSGGAPAGPAAPVLLVTLALGLAAARRRRARR